MTLAAVYNNLTTEQLKGMLGAARADHRRILEEIKAKHASAIEAWRQALANAKKEWAAQLQKQESENALLRRELHSTRDELERAHALLADQTKRLVSFERVAELEQKLQIARKATA
jgi:chromosome segregation ATPase